MRTCSSCFRGSDVTESPLSHDVNLTVCDASVRYLRLKNRTNFYCCGPPNQLGSFKKRHGMFRVRLKGLTEVEQGREAEYEFIDAKTENLDVPYLDELPVDLYLGRSIEILGKALTNCKRFSINLSTGKDNDSDLALHFNPRLDRRIVVRNHRICSKWGVEEIVSVQPFPFKPGKNFSVVIFIADEQFLIAINKVHYCAFSFRIPLLNITHLVITGDIVLNLIKYCKRVSYPPSIFKKIPYVIVPNSATSIVNKCDIRRKVQAIETGTKIEIFGRLKLLPRGFYINLQEGLCLWPHPLIAFHMNLRLYPPGTRNEEHQIIFNSWLNGSWGKETTIKMCPFLPGDDFHVVIECNSTCFLVEVNDKFLYKHKKMENLKVDCLIVHGDVTIRKVIIRKSKAVNSAIR